MLFCDTDCGGVVSNVAYLRFVEAARMDLLSALGATPRQMMESGCFAAVVRTEIDYRVPAVLGDEIRISAELDSVEKVRARCRFELMIQREGSEVVAARALQTVAMIQMPSGKPRRIPEEWSGLVGA